MFKKIANTLNSELLALRVEQYFDFLRNLPADRQRRIGELFFETMSKYYRRYKDLDELWEAVQVFTHAEESQLKNSIRELKYSKSSCSNSDESCALDLCLFCFESFRWEGYQGERAVSNRTIIIETIVWWLVKNGIDGVPWATESWVEAKCAAIDAIWKNRDRIRNR